MNTFLIRRLAAHLLMWSCLSIFVVGLCSCGGGGGGDDEALEPAPRTFDGLVLTLYTGGVELTFIRAEGDAATGVETGSVSMKENPAKATATNPGGGTDQVLPSYSISGGRYVYTRLGPESGTLTVTGQGSGFFGALAGGVDTPSANYFEAGEFTREYALLFGSDGVYVSGIRVNDWGEGFDYPGIAWSGATLKVYGGSPLLLGWSLKNSALLDLPKLYPLSISQQTVDTTPDEDSDDEYTIEFLTSTFTRYSDAKGDFLEKGVCNITIYPDAETVIGNYTYKPDPLTTNRAVLTIYFETDPPVTAKLTFLDLESGTYIIQEDGSTGEFNFPFLD